MAKFATIGVTTTLPGLNSPVSGSLSVENCNSLSVAGMVTAGSGKLYLLRKVYLTAGDWQFRLWRSDRPINVDVAALGGYFDGVFVLPENCAREELAIYNPSSVTMAAGEPVACGETIHL